MMKKKIALLTASSVLIAASVLGCRQNTGEPDPNFVSVQPPSSGSEPSPQRVEGIKVIEGESTLSQTSSLSGSSPSMAWLLRTIMPVSTHPAPWSSDHSTRIKVGFGVLK